MLVHLGITAPTEFSEIDLARDYRPAIFAAGGITGCPDWQADFLALLTDVPVIVFNPRQENFPIDDPSAARQQITWEYRHLRRAHGIAFWFCAEAIQPIALYELGAWSMTDVPLFVGVAPGYVREQDVQIQTELVRPDVEIVNTLYALAENVARWDRVPDAPGDRK